MTGEEFREAQAVLGRTNEKMADDLCVCVRSIKNYRRKGCPDRIAKLVEMIRKRRRK